MGTTYFIIDTNDAETADLIGPETPRRFIGKVSGDGKGSFWFYWGIDPVDFIRRYEVDRNILFIEDEYGARFHPSDWVRFILGSCSGGHYDKIGEEFS